MAVPVFYEAKLKGVIELASLKNFDAVNKAVFTAFNL